MRFVTCIVHELWLYEHVARFPDGDPAHQILSAREHCEWRRPTGRPPQRPLQYQRNVASWLQHVDQHFKEIGMGQASAFGWADRGSWSTGGKWTQRRAALALAPIPDLT